MISHIKKEKEKKKTLLNAWTPVKVKMVKEKTRKPGASLITSVMASCFALLELELAGKTFSLVNVSLRQMDCNVGWNGVLFTMICTCPFLQESGEFSLSSLHPPIRHRTASCTWGLEGGCGRREGGDVEREGGAGRMVRERKRWCKGKKLVEELFLKLVWQTLERGDHAPYTTYMLHLYHRNGRCTVNTNLCKKSHCSWGNSSCRLYNS